MGKMVSETGIGKPVASQARKVLVFGVFAFVIVAMAAWFLCESRIQYRTQVILNRQRDVEQAHISKALDNIRVWANEVITQMRFVSSSEMFRLFIADATNMDEAALEQLAQPDALHSHDETIRILAEQHAYIQDLLKDLTQRRAWNEARIVSPSGKDIVSEDFAKPLVNEQIELVKEAIKSGQTTFGSLRQSGAGIIMDIADPLFEVMGINEPKGIAALVVSVPMDRALASFLLSAGEHGGSLYARIIDKSLGNNELIFMRGNLLQLVKIALPPELESLPFEERQAFIGNENVYSMAAPAILLNWLFVSEIPADVIQKEINSEEWNIRLLGLGASFLIALVGAFIWGLTTSHAHKLRSQELEKLNKKIEQQKLLLDGINSSLDTGVLLVDGKSYIQVCNPAFCRICGIDKEAAKNMPLPEALRGEPGIQLISAMANVREKGKNATIELQIPNKEGEKRLYRVNLFPYSALPGEMATSGSGCVAIFQDITAFRASAERARQRQEALIRAMDRAIASVDPNLVGQSLKMASLVQLLADKLGLDASQKETLRLSAMLSQIGKLFVPKELLQKPEKLTPEELKEVARAPEYADNILRDLHFGLPVQQTVREMNERMDGSGPNATKGEDISTSGRVLSVASAFVAMTSPRAWRKTNALSLHDAIKALMEDSRFDAKVTQALSELDIAQLLPIVSEQPQRPVQ